MYGAHVLRTCMTYRVFITTTHMFGIHVWAWPHCYSGHTQFLMVICMHIQHDVTSDCEHCISRHVELFDRQSRSNVDTAAGWRDVDRLAGYDLLLAATTAASGCNN